MAKRRVVTGAAPDVPEAARPETAGPAASLVGRMIDARWRLVEELGPTAHGVAFRVEDAEHGRAARLDLWEARHLAERGRMAQLERQARIVRGLHHPRCLALRHFGVEDGRPFFVTELAGGKRVADELGSGELTVRRAIAIALQVLDGLRHLHAHGVVHREIASRDRVAGDLADRRGGVHRAAAAGGNRQRLGRQPRRSPRGGAAPVRDVRGPRDARRGRAVPDPALGGTRPRNRGGDRAGDHARDRAVARGPVPERGRLHRRAPAHGSRPAQTEAGPGRAAAEAPAAPGPAGGRRGGAGAGGAGGGAARARIDAGLRPDAGAPARPRPRGGAAAPGRPPAPPVAKVSPAGGNAPRTTGRNGPRATTRDRAARGASHRGCPAGGGPRARSGSCCGEGELDAAEARVIPLTLEHPRAPWPHTARAEIFFQRAWRRDSVRAWTLALELDRELVHGTHFGGRLCRMLDAKWQEAGAARLLALSGKEATPLLRRCVATADTPALRAQARRALQQRKASR